MVCINVLVLNIYIYIYIYIYILIDWLYLIVALVNSSFPWWARAGSKRTSSRRHYPREIKLLHSFIHSHFLATSWCRNPDFCLFNMHPWRTYPMQHKARPTVGATARWRQRRRQQPSPPPWHRQPPLYRDRRMLHRCSRVKRETLEQCVCLLQLTGITAQSTGLAGIQRDWELTYLQISVCTPPLPPLIRARSFLTLALYFDLAASLF